jgi:hypothetical protein
LSRAVRSLSLWIVGEWLRGTLLTGFPWLASGYAHAPPSPLAGYVPVLGVHGAGWDRRIDRRSAGGRRAASAEAAARQPWRWLV